MVLALFTVLVAPSLGFGAAEEFIVRAVRGGEVQPLLVGLGGVAVGLPLAAAGVAWWRGRPAARRRALVAAVSSAAFHVYATLPSRRNVGLLALLAGAGSGLILLTAALSSTGAKTRAA